MRLLDSQTLELHEFIGTQVPQYAILSHTWDKGEVSFQDMMSCNTSEKRGYDKIKRCCEVALSDGFKYAWVDTCCIDKTSSSELSEAINSMYRWYSEAAVCYVILSDVPSDEDCRLPSSAFRTSRWFTRGWTLQELIAPKSVVFYGRDWREIGTKASLRDLISEITEIHIHILSGHEMLQSFSVAQKMSWASHRCTTRTEDLAYCMMGLFEVNMPLLYGEGSKSFFRLQEQIIAHSDDESIFAWTSEDNERSSFLAISPRDFAGAGNIVQSRRKSTLPFSITNQGLYMQESLYVQEDIVRREILLLDCSRQGDMHYLCVPVRTYWQGSNQCMRSGFKALQTTSGWNLAGLTPKSIYMNIDPYWVSFVHRKSVGGECYVETKGLRENGVTIRKIDPILSGRTGSSIAFWKWYGYFVGGLRFCNGAGDRFDVILRNGPTEVDRITAVIKRPRRGSSRSPLPADWDEYISSPAEGSDRLRWHDPSKNLWIKVTIRAQSISDEDEETRTGDYAYKMKIEWDEPGDSRVYQSINLEELAVSAGLVEDRRKPRNLQGRKRV